MLSQKTRYSIRALQYLADRSGEGFIPLTEISEAQNIPVKLLTILLATLAREGFVCTQRGKGGGYSLARPPSDISHGEIIRLTQGTLALVPCASRGSKEKCKNCIDESKCRLHSIMLKVRDATAHILDNVTLADQIPS